ncbi:D-inositol-3-phosphate glycosyltransferase [Methylorubrum extorquens]
MNIMQISGYETPGMRFNGLSLTPLLRERGINSTHMIWQRDTADPSILSFDSYKSIDLNKLYAKVENITSMQSVLYQNVRHITESECFAAADLVHFHLIHTGYLSLLDLREITRSKPTVWTIHDPWAFTGHCVYPMGCERWRIGCGQCPDLTINFPMRSDNTAMMFEYKKYSYSQAKFEIIVASDWMKSMAEQSPLFEGVRIHKIPFGVDLDFFSKAKGSEIRRKHGIPNDAIVICFRSQEEFKGLHYIKEALSHIRAESDIYLITVANTGLLDEFNDRYKIIEFGWVNDPALLRDIISASDIFLMPSTAEAFGVMAIEAMACCKPVICFEETSLPEVTNSPRSGIAVPMKDAVALAKAITRLIENPEERLSRGRRGLEFARNNYDEIWHAKQMAELYRDVVARWSV